MATKRAFGPIEELAQALLTDCRHGATCLHCLRDRTEELLDSLVTLGLCLPLLGGGARLTPLADVNLPAPADLA